MEIWISVLVPLLTVTATVFATIYTVNRRIDNEKKENHKPYIILKSVEPLNDLNPYDYHLALGETDKEQTKIYLNLGLENIGYGVATNVKFYDLHDGKQVKGVQERDPNMNQKLFTTCDIASTKNKNVQIEISHIKDKITENRIICIYQDLNHNIYDLIICINIKPSDNYDFCAYQPSSKSYNSSINSNKKNYQKIINEYGNL